jgi:hypothetical protein
MVPNETVAILEETCFNKETVSDSIQGEAM